MSFVARSTPLDWPGNGRGLCCVAPANHSLSPYEFYVAELQRKYQLLTNAGIEEDLAFEIASCVAMEKANARTAA